MIVKGITDERTECECCGKKNIKCTVALGLTDADGNWTGDVVHYGRDCAARALYGRTSASLATRVEREALAIVHAAKLTASQKMARVVSADDLQTANRRYAATRRPLAESYFARRGNEVVRVDGSDAADAEWFSTAGFTHA